MLKNLPFFIGYRYTRSKRREGFVSFISSFSVAAMALGVMALIVVLSVMNGFDKEIKQRLLRIIPHATVAGHPRLTLDQLVDIRQQIIASGDRDVTAVVPMVQGFVMLSKDDSQVGVSLQGIDEAWPTADLLKENMLSGYVEQLAPGDFSIILGSQIARQLSAFIGDKIQVTLPLISVTPAGIFPQTKRVTVSGIFEVGAQVDASIAFMHQQDMQKLMRLGDNYQGFQLQFKDPYKVDSWLNSNASSILPNHQWRSWSSTMSSLFQAMRMEKLVVSLLLSVIIAVAAFNIIASLVLIVADKRKDIAVIRTMGANSSLITKIFIVQGMTVGAAGVLSGALLGCFIAYFIGDIVGIIENLLGVYLFDPSIYLINALPSKIVFSDVAAVVGIALTVSFLATLYPAWRAGKILPAEALRYDH
ncbi:MAG: lipoprotein-releasing ABC transporter permease subunit [Porticoccaceae bacterium]|nr:lipoprotein-releasing ABC transporter permease subunit [Porticoccaceae bacterium]MBT6421990.1 lipoprotein-releasing ABC transporter permease subunit [Porticoccaceae bacterium]